MRVNSELQRLLDEVGAELIRQTNHRVYRIPGVQQLFIIGSSPSDIRASKNNIARLRRLLRQGKDNDGIQTVR